MRISNRFYILLFLMAFAVSAHSQGANKRFIKKGIKNCSCPLFSTLVGAKCSKIKSLFSELLFARIDKELSLVATNNKIPISNNSLSLSYPMAYRAIRAPPLS